MNRLEFYCFEVFADSALFSHQSLPLLFLSGA